MNNIEQLNSPLGQKPLNNGGSSVHPCPNFNYNYLVNKTTGELIALGCKRYDCPHCGPKKAFKLKTALESKLKQYQIIRLFTFTFRTSIFANELHCLMRSGEIWRRFINNIRRDKGLSESSRKFQYIKVIEFTRRGYVHFHVFVSSYIEWAILQYHWNNAINRVMSVNGKNGHVNAKGSRWSSSASARYVAKYLVKSAIKVNDILDNYGREFRKKVKLYTKSAEIVLWGKKEPTGDWLFFADVSKKYKLNLSILEVSSHELPEIIENYFKIKSSISQILKE